MHNTRSNEPGIINSVLELCYSHLFAHTCAVFVEYHFCENDGTFPTDSSIFIFRFGAVNLILT